MKEGREYIFRVCAENLAGRGAWSDPSEPECALDPLAPPGRPGKPEVLAVGDTTASLKWKAPKEGVESIEHYVLEMRKRPQTDMEAEREAAAAAEAIEVEAQGGGDAGGAGGEHVAYTSTSARLRVRSSPGSSTAT